MAKWGGGKIEHEILQDTRARIADALGVPIQAIWYVTTVEHNGQNWTVRHEWQQSDESSGGHSSRFDGARLTKQFEKVPVAFGSPIFNLLSPIVRCWARMLL